MVHTGRQALVWARTEVLVVLERDRSQNRRRLTYRYMPREGEN